MQKGDKSQLERSVSELWLLAKVLAVFAFAGFAYLAACQPGGRAFDHLVSPTKA